MQEIEVMMRFKHPNILRFLEAKKTSNNIYIFLEFCNGGDLRRFLDLKNGKLEEKVVKNIVKQIAQGLNHLNENDTVHRDLKLDNILINFPKYKKAGTVPDEYIRDFDFENDEMEVIIGDLGFATCLEKDNLATSYCGTPLNMAPEIMNGDYYNTKVDIWSLGTMMYEMLVGFAPFTGVNPEDLAHRINKGDYGVPKNIKISLTCLDLLNKWLQHQPEKRICHDEVICHPFLLEYEEEESIDLSVSRGGDQESFFDVPSSGFDISQKNAVIFNVRESWLFNDAYNKSMKKFAKRQEENKEELVPEFEDLKHLPEAELQEVVEIENEDFEIMENSMQEDIEPRSFKTKGLWDYSEKVAEKELEISPKNEGFGLETDKQASELQIPEYQPVGIENDLEKNIDKDQIKEIFQQEFPEESHKEDFEVHKISEPEPFLQNEEIALPSKEIKPESIPNEIVEKPSEIVEDPSSSILDEIVVPNNELEVHQPEEEVQSPVQEVIKEGKDPENEEKPSDENKKFSHDAEEEPKKETQEGEDQRTEEEVKKQTDEMLRKLDVVEQVGESVIPDERPEGEDGTEKKIEESFVESVENIDGSDFTIIDESEIKNIPKNLSPALSPGKAPIEVPEEEASPEKDVSEEKENSTNITDLDSSFEIVHKHDIYLMEDKDYYTFIS